MALADVNLAGFVRKGLNIQLYKNSFFIITTRFLTVVTGFVFWLVAARLYSIENVGLATALFSAATLILQFSTFGLENSIMRFFGSHDKNKVINTSLIVTTVSAFIFGLVYIMIAGIVSPDLGFIQEPLYGTIFLFFVIISSVVMVTGSAFVGLRKAEYALSQNIVLMSRIVFLVPLFFLGAIGILSAIGIAYVLVCILVFYQMRKFVRFAWDVDYGFLQKYKSFFSGNYISNMLYNATYSITPILVLNILGEVAAAKYYIAFTIGCFFFQIPYSVGTSLLVEGSHGESLRKNAFRALGIIYAILIPANIFIYFFGSSVLALFGAQYVESTDLLRIIAFSSFFFAIYALMIPIQNVRMKVRSVLTLNVVLFVLFAGLSCIFLIYFGVVGVGYAMLTTYLIMALIVLGIIKMEGWL
ncbi:oligosaccharide flippase family protein [Methanocella arvoryzae]|uniref:Oligosaccharide repeat unit transporter n=1 Tax=Methanocella arvoryzae (strain DSM 22066 / NBRC 105507 / MRE50) TaxID=351160 RepID=Q0W3D9_METAR|nr:oligosaccharide flippase family protein [Methanocella arvoryzae]CAJ37104.1 putative oligosaccharide repeat unit transporter [Methanocella arvoryzae MRE50]